MARRSVPGGFAAVASSDDTLTLAEAKLASSGLTLADAEMLGIQWLTPGQTVKLGTWAKALPALFLPYHGPDGAPLSSWPAHPPFYRLRYLRDPPAPAGFAAQTAPKKPLRYVQPPDTCLAAYLPRCAQVDWLDVMSDPACALVITEGELKSACACVRGIPTLGLGGVSSWQSTDKGVEFLPELEAITWVARHVYVCFDSDYRSNDNVLTALHHLAEALVRRGAYVKLVSLPQVTDQKVGLDDFIVAEGVAAFEECLKAAEPLGLTRPLFDLNARFIYVRHPGLMLDRWLRERLSTSAFVEHAEAARVYQERALRADGSISRKAVSAAATWLRWPLRAEVDRLTYQPGAVGRVTQPSGAVEWSTWPGWGAPPAAVADTADVQPFLDLVQHVFKGAEPAAINWFLRWCAYPLRYPGTKLFSSVLIWGRRHGTGKSLLGYTLGAIYGENFTEIKQSDIHATFNEWAEGKQLVMGDDITGSDKRQDNDLLKKLITQNRARINIKFLPTYEVPDCINYFWTANHPDAFFLEDDDRRSFIHEVVVGPLPEEFYVDYGLWLETDGPSKLHRWLLGVDLGDFNPAAPAYYTQAKDRMIADTQSDVGTWVRQLLATPDAFLRVGEVKLTKDLYTNKELLRLYDPEQRGRLTANGLGRELKRAGARQVLGGAPVKGPDGSLDRYYAVRNVDHWLAAELAAVREHLAPEAGSSRRGGRF